jgi:hypothetical protein
MHRIAQCSRPRHAAAGGALRQEQPVSARSIVQQVVSGPAKELVAAAVGLELVLALPMRSSPTSVPNFCLNSGTFAGASLFDNTIYNQAERETNCYYGLG